MLTDAPPAAPAAQPISTADPFSAYFRILQHDARDTQGRGLKAGTRILANPAAPQEMMEDNPANRSAFAASDFTWRPETRSQIWFESAAHEASFQAQLARAHAHMTEFLAAMDVNIADPRHGMRGQLFPVNGRPFWSGLLPWQPRVGRVELLPDTEASDFSDGLITAIAGEEQAGAPGDVIRPQAWLESLRTVNKIRVYRLRSLTGVVDVVVAFVTPVHVAAPGRAAVAGAGSKTLDALTTNYARWRESRGDRARFVFMVLGTPVGWQIEGAHLAGAGFLALCAAPHDGQGAQHNGVGSWDIIAPPSQGAPSVSREFLDHLRPETQGARAAAIRAVVDYHLPSAGKVAPELVERTLGYSRVEVVRAFVAMEQSHGYRIERDGDKLWISRPAAAAPWRASRKRRPPPWRLTVGLSLFIVPNVLAAWMHGWGLGVRGQIGTLVASIAAAYLWAMLTQGRGHA